jgi:hypothetical protein
LSVVVDAGASTACSLSWRRDIRSFSMNHWNEIGAMLFYRRAIVTLD